MNRLRMFVCSLAALVSIAVLAQKGNFQTGDYGYLFCHMNDRGRAWTAYALSRDGLHYHDLLGGDSIFSDYEHARIEGATRDAYICRKHDGTGFLMACTDMNVGRFKDLGKQEEWDNYGICLLHSDDLIHWESKSFDYRQGLGIFCNPDAESVYQNWKTVNRVWAPQIMWDEDYIWPDGKRGGYFVYYSMWNRAEEAYDRMYYSYADETFTRLTQPRLLFDWGYATIDADINWVEADHQWHMMIKKEGGKPGLFTATAPALTGPWSEPVEDDYVSFEGNKKCEGVSAFQLAGHDDWMIGYIEYSSKPRNYRLCMADRNMRNFHSPRNIEGVARPQHGSFLRLTKEEYDRLEAWTGQTSEVVWFDGTSPITYSLPKKVEPVVKTALDMWKNDMQQVTGRMPVVSARPTIRVVQGNGPADGFRIYTKGGQIIVEGNNGRGMAYGILELSRLAGVSPWIWWGDVVPEKKQRLAMNTDFKTEQCPSVEYRGIFLNDEDWSLRHWSYSTFERLRVGDGTSGMPAPFGYIGPQTYKKIFQLLLRLRANAIWPGMHTGTTAFFKIPGAKAMADSCGIVIGTSHCEPLLRNNVGEWDVKARGAFNYRTNREAVQRYWIERLQEVRKSKDNMFTIGMRGIHDSSMEGYKTDEEKFEGLQQVINDQQELLRKYIGDPSKQMQVFVPYKEVLQLYEKGLQVPDYVTLMWCDDNYGYMTRLSDAQEQQRTGGGGVYYHLSYWGRPHDYLWLTTTQPGLVYNEMRQAYDHNVRKLWIANVHDPKVAGYDLELFLDMAWNIDAVNGETLNDHYRAWLCRQFGMQAGERLFPVMHEFFRLCGERRPEFMGWNQVEVDKRLYDRGLSQVRNSGWTDAQREDFLARFSHISQEVGKIGQSIRPELADAYFTAIQYPVQASAAHAVKMLEAEKARLMANGSTMGDLVENQAKIQQSVNRSFAAYERIHELTSHYNNKVAGGKWKNLMCDHPRDLPVFWAPLTPTMPDEAVSYDAISYTPSTSHSSLITHHSSLSPQAKEIQMLGHSMNALALPKGGQVTYRFTIEKTGDYSLWTAMIPTQPNDNGDIRYRVIVDDGEPTVYSLKEPFRSEPWKQNVLRGQALREKRVSLSEGTHQLTIEAIDDHIVIDQWWLSSDYR